MTAGPFSVTRNPLYTFSLVATLGAGLQSGSALFGFTAAAFYMIVMHGAVRGEEAALSDRFGAIYAKYCAQTPRYAVRLSLWRAERELTISMPLMYRTAVESGLFFAAAPLAEIIRRLQQAEALPVLVRLV